MQLGLCPDTEEEIWPDSNFTLRNANTCDGGIGSAQPIASASPVVGAAPNSSTHVTALHIDVTERETMILKTAYLGRRMPWIQSGP